MGWTSVRRLVGLLWGEGSEARPVPQFDDCLTGTAGGLNAMTIWEPHTSAANAGEQPLSNSTDQGERLLIGRNSDRTIGDEHPRGMFYPDGRRTGTLDDRWHHAEADERTADPTAEQPTGVVEFGSGTDRRRET